MRARCLRLMVPAVLLAVTVGVPAGAQDEPPSLKELITSQNNLKQIGLACLNYESAYALFPGDIVDKDGKPLLSWRVQILPYIEEQKLYESFKLDEAWDSDNNKKLIEKLPKVYAPIHIKAKAGETFYQTFTGKGTLFPSPGKGPKITEITDGTSNTVLVVEAGDPVIWSKPGGIAYDATKPVPKLGGMFEGVFHVAWCDGSVSRVRRDFDPAELKKAISPAGGETFDRNKLSK